MKKHVSKVRVRYGETDQMGVVHHGKYAQYLELGRIAWLKSYGISYKKLEENGVMLPVYELNIKYLKPAYFDDELLVETTLKEAPRVRISFQYRIENQQNEVITRAETTLVFMDKKKRKPIFCPPELQTALAF